MKYFIMRMVSFNDTETFSEAFRSKNFNFNLVCCEFDFGVCIIRLSTKCPPTLANGNVLCCMNIQSDP